MNRRDPTYWPALQAYGLKRKTEKAKRKHLEEERAPKSGHLESRVHVDGAATAGRTCKRTGESACTHAKVQYQAKGPCGVPKQNRPVLRRPLTSKKYSDMFLEKIAIDYKSN